MEKNCQTRLYENINEIRACLPHRYPFLFIDKVESVVKGVSITTVKNVIYADCYNTSGDYWFPSEFILEAFGQAAILLFFADNTKNPDSYQTILVGINNFSILGRVTYGDSIKIEVSFEKIISNAAIIKGRASIEGKEIAEGMLTVAFKKKLE